jgi:hypothetical protein
MSSENKSKFKAQQHLNVDELKTQFARVGIPWLSSGPAMRFPADNRFAARLSSVSAASDGKLLLTCRLNEGAVDAVPRVF